MTTVQLLNEVEDLLKTMPTIQSFGVSNQAIPWIGRASAVFDELGATYAIPWETQARAAQGTPNQRHAAYFEMVRLLHKARHALIMKAPAPQSVTVDAGKVFDYYEGLRGIIEQANTDILFVDPYLDAEFVSRYLPSVKGGAAIRLLAREKLATLVPAVQSYNQQHCVGVQVRSAANFHDRFVFVDKVACYQSSGSFKDGGKKTPVVIMPLADAASTLLTTYEALWASGIVKV